MVILLVGLFGAFGGGGEIGIDPVTIDILFKNHNVSALFGFEGELFEFIYFVVVIRFLF